MDFKKAVGCTELSKDFIALKKEQKIKKKRTSKGFRILYNGANNIYTNIILYIVTSLSPFIIRQLRPYHMTKGLRPKEPQAM